ncbi:MAG: hypothetical protein A3J93_04650 [Candidatus Magasanikbacteria bacterium RIFOXYC2_FULL_42_28]|uniref:Pseudouridine synthase n=1 Tax=Candidatus Magasanikbacteria bacterium RIFOXYC2_FULL_42_28 TaxID=1798704 RepID=A0A1F6NWL3_9BACT|nr:MAG: hypothetical protein A3J93_04650 [Candidatus Magasanikbacteria bacterium RIFOXYC2_FULL_42_28]
MTTKTLTIKTEDKGTRLDVFLTEKLAVTRSQIQKMISAEQITVNGEQPQKMGLPLKPDDKISISNKVLNTKSVHALFTVKDIKIIAETPDYFVVEKPTGMLTHSTTRGEADSLAYLLAEKHPELNKVGDNVKLRPGIVHRLDKEASGLLVVARTQAMFENLKNQFQSRAVGKEYFALAHGVINRDEDKLSFRIGRSETDDKMAAIPESKKGLFSEDGKDASTEFEVTKRFINFTLCRVKIKTGRMHQIRAHFLAYNHPLCGDPMYNQRKRPNKTDKKLGRLFLHCAKLGFVDLKSEFKEFESVLPKELENFLTTLQPPRALK